ncbi:MAG TPA: GNAT family N-acetyltransferase [Leptospiraceae bacterium]|nr:GNAT family N-acetyltransferase [Leptospiraceae bacterium]HMX31633.1 GNAT family N-acetyltransferase [Leptospiraceae bacterium]HMY30482.1 GNAT family N-acetyltransferase [Leptospiraceae bacterium]HMZ65583.1 GNAT family N-acetyltransferase [Leptospiraceae bacterium]HNA06489.1 GNAT family N-acetyltransferase [Leptospiraceae bacterium]
MIRSAKIDDSVAITKIHLETLPNDLLPRLGFSFLKNYYHNLLSSSQALVIVNEDSGQINSFVIFAYNTFELSKLIKKNKIFLAYSILKATFSDFRIPILVLNFIFGKEKYNIKIEEIETIPELYSIATASNYKSKGIGAAITKFGLEILKNKTHRQGCIVKTSSKRAKQFYERLGFLEIGETIRGNNKLSILYIPFEEIR